MRTRVFATVLSAVLTSSVMAHAKSPVQLAPTDASQTTLLQTVLMVNKTVGTEQWVLVLDADNLGLTGNVFDLGGKPPTFFFCDVEFSPDNWTTAAEIAAETLTLNCQVAGGCTTLPCTSDWQPVGSSISLPGSFFLPSS